VTTRSFDGTVSWNRLEGVYSYQATDNPDKITGIIIPSFIPDSETAKTWRTDIEAHHRIIKSTVNELGESKIIENSYGISIATSPSDCSCTIGSCRFTEEISGTESMQRELISEQRIEDGFWKATVFRRNPGSADRRMIYHTIRSFDASGGLLDSYYEDDEYQILLFGASSVRD